MSLQKETGFVLISFEELKHIDSLWDSEGDLSRRMLCDTYYEVYNKRLPWDEYKEPLYDNEIVQSLERAANEADIPFELITKLIVAINNNKYIAKTSKMEKEFDRILNQEWIHHESIKAGLNNED